VNNRNLRTFKTDIQNSIDLKKHIPAKIITISESGINTKADCEILRENGFDAVLVGESLMREADPGKAIFQLLGIQ
jgi:indole-3-glycerol phosphate synthase